MKVLLIQPPISMEEENLGSFNSMPLGLAYVAAMLEKNGIDVKIIDGFAFGLSEEQLRKELNVYSPDIVGLSVVTPRAKQSAEIARIVKEENPNVCTVLGGPHVSALCELVVKQDYVDAGVFGEGEFTMLDLVNAVGNGKDFSAIAGVIHKKDGKVIKNAARELLKDLDQLPHPAFHMLPLDKYTPFPTYSRGRKGGYSNLITARGCPHQCTYCDVQVTSGRGYRTHSPQYTVDVIEHLYKKYDVRNFSFRDSIFTLNKKRVIEMCELIKKRGLDISWSCNSRVNHVDENLLRIMRSAGCWQIQYGVESGNQEVLDRAARGITLAQIKKAFKITKKAGLDTHGYFMVGLPGETNETIKDTVKLAKEISPDLLGFSIAIPFPGTQFYDWANKHDYLRIEDWNSFVYNTAVVETPEFSIQDALNAQKWALRSYYLRPSMILKRIVRIRSLKDVKSNFKYAKMLFFGLKDAYRG